MTSKGLSWEQKARFKPSVLSIPAQDALGGVEQGGVTGFLRNWPVVRVTAILWFLW